jgi:hypothetical protein
MSEANVISACESLIDFHAWDHTKIDPRGWMNNFERADRPIAAALLGRFTFYSDQLVDQLFRAAFQSLSNLAPGGWKPFATAQTEWRDFCANALITLVQGENPNPADSGWLFARKARQILGVSEAQLVTPAEAIGQVLAGHSGAVIFVDDFVGSGEQFIRTWRRQMVTPHHGQSSFEQATQINRTAEFYYCNAMTTVRGRDRIAAAAPNVRVSAGNLVPYDHSLSGLGSVLWRADEKASGIEMIRRISTDLGYREDNGGLNDWEGFHKLGLGLAFEHSVPDATLPVFYTDRNGWTPLVRRA